MRQKVYIITPSGSTTHSTKSLSIAKATVHEILEGYRASGHGVVRIELARCSRWESKTYPVNPNDPSKGTFTRDNLKRWWRPVNDGFTTVSYEPCKNAWSIKTNGRRVAIVAIIPVEEPQEVVWVNYPNTTDSTANQ